MFKVKLKKYHEKKGYVSAYQVSKQSGIAENTVRKYIDTDVVDTARIEPSLVKLIQFYELDWQNPEVVQFVEDEDSPKGTAPLAVAV